MRAPGHPRQGRWCGAGGRPPHEASPSLEHLALQIREGIVAVTVTSANPPPLVRRGALSAGDPVRDASSLVLPPVLPQGWVPVVDWVPSDPGIGVVVKTGTTVGTVTGPSPVQAIITAGGNGASESAVVSVNQGP